MEFLRLSATEKASQVDVTGLLHDLGVINWDMKTKALKDIESLSDRMSDFTDATKETLKAGEPLLRRMANRASEEMSGKLHAALDHLVQQLSLEELEKASPTEAVESQHPPMPSYSFIKEALECQFPSGIVVSRMGVQKKNEKGDFEYRVEEERGPAVFSASHLNNPLSAHSPGQPKFFKKHILVAISAGQEFRGSGGPFGGSRGLYAYDGTRLTHLDGDDAKRNVGEILRAEALELHKIDPVELSWFFCHTIVPGFIGAHTVVAPSEDAKANEVVTKPSLARTENHGWKIHFWTTEIQGGCFPTIPTLCEHTIIVSPQYDIDYVQNECKAF
ncbi:MAG TPA: hypothetical protein V6D17_10780 [Candidatus Obscuribacterales bacterium]